jgi:hypothetical protein
MNRQMMASMAVIGGLLALAAPARADYVLLGELITCEGRAVLSNEPVAVRSEFWYDADAEWAQIRSDVKLLGQPVQKHVAENFGLNDGGIWLSSGFGFFLTGGQRLLVDGFDVLLNLGVGQQTQTYSVLCKRGMNWSDIVKQECRRSAGRFSFQGFR